MSKRITPFANGFEFLNWQTNNCDQCCRYSNVSDKRSNAKCKLAFDLDLASVTDGTISTKTAEKIGINNGQLSTICNDFNKPIIRKKYSKKEAKNQKSIFDHE